MVSATGYISTSARSAARRISPQMHRMMHASMRWKRLQASWEPLSLLSTPTKAIRQGSEEPHGHDESELLQMTREILPELIISD